MRHWLELVLLGVIQGLTEFLPISSDGHLALAEQWLGITEANLAITVALHFGTLGAVILYFRKDLERLLRALPKVISGTALVEDRALIFAIVAGSIPTAIIGLALKGPTESLAKKMWAVGAFLLVSGVWNLVIAVRGQKGGFGRGPEALTLVDAIAIGVVQGLAVLPGLSRSASTIGTGVTMGLSREFAAKFSFLLSLPAVGGALLLEAKDISELPMSELGPIFLGTAVSFTVGIFALWALFAMLKTGRFGVFAWYCWMLGATVIYLGLR